MFRDYSDVFEGSEDDMVKMFIKKFIDRELIFGDKWIRGKYYEQVSVLEVGRVSDLIVMCGSRRLINIEFKLKNYSCVFQQAKDHLKWCDYSYICIPFDLLIWIPRSFIKDVLEAGIGLLAATKTTFIEVFRARHNTYKSGKSKTLRTKVFIRLQSKEPVKLEPNGRLEKSTA